VPKKIGLKTDCGQSWNNDALINLWKAKATIATATSVSGSDQIVHVLLKKHWNTVPKILLFHARASSTKVVTIAFLERYDRYEAQGRRVMFSVGETRFGRTFRSVYGNLRSTEPVLCTIGLEEKAHTSALTLSNQ